jgi:hypothetical protein
MGGASGAPAARCLQGILAPINALIREERINPAHAASELDLQQGAADVFERRRGRGGRHPCVGVAAAQLTFRIDFDVLRE